MATPLTEEKNLKMPEAFGGNLGMDKGRLEQAAANEAMRLGGGQITPESAARTIQTPYGVMSTNAPTMTQSTFETSTAGVQGAARPERYTVDGSGGFQRQLSGADDRALAIARASEAGSNIASNLQQQSTNRYYAFRQGLEERRAAEALTPSAYEGFTPGRDRRMAGAQAMVAAERWKQVAGGQREAMDRTPVQAFGGQFTQSGMGQFSPVQRPTYATGGTQTSTLFPTFATPRPTTQSSILGSGGSAFSFTPFTQRQEQESDPMAGFRTAVRSRTTNNRFTTLPFGMRQSGTI